MIKSVIGTEYTISTNQLDFLATQTFGLTYIGEDGAEHPVYVIHRAPLGTHERFTAFLIEHYAGAFPTWLAPVQARIIPISEKVADYAQKVRETLFQVPVVNGTAGLRVDIDLTAERMQKKIRDAQLQKIPYMLVVGEREAAEGKVAVRLRSGKDLGADAAGNCSSPGSKARRNPAKMWRNSPCRNRASRHSYSYARQRPCAARTRRKFALRP